MGDLSPLPLHPRNRRVGAVDRPHRLRRPPDPFLLRRLPDDSADGPRVPRRRPVRIDVLAMVVMIMMMIVSEFLFRSHALPGME